MAILDKANVYGGAGPLVYRRYQGKTVIQTKPKKFKQTAATRVAAIEFGICSSAAKAIRSAFRDLYVHREGKLVNRMNSVVSKAVRGSKTAALGERDLHDGDLSFLEGFEFNPNSMLSAVLTVKPMVSRGPNGEVFVDIPDIDTRKHIRAGSFSRGKSFRIQIVVVAFDFRRNYFEYSGAATINPVRSMFQAQRIEFKEDIPAGCIVMVGMSLEVVEVMSLKGPVSVNNRQFSPAAIIAAFHSENAPAPDMDYREQRLAMCRETAFPQKVQVMVYRGNSLKQDLPEQIERLQKAGKLRKGQPYTWLGVAEAEAKDEFEELK